MFTQLPSGSLKGEYQESADINLLPEEFPAELGIRWDHFVEPGWGDICGGAFQASNGGYFCLMHFYAMRRNKVTGTAIYTLPGLPNEAATIDAALSDLRLGSQALVWLRKDIRFDAHDLIRQDDNGSRFTVGTFSCRADAECKLREMERAVHKQTYWVVESSTKEQTK